MHKRTRPHTPHERERERFNGARWPQRARIRQDDCEQTRRNVLIGFLNHHCNHAGISYRPSTTEQPSPLPDYRLTDIGITVPAVSVPLPHPERL